MPSLMGSFPDNINCFILADNLINNPFRNFDILASLHDLSYTHYILILPLSSFIFILLVSYIILVTLLFIINMLKLALASKNIPHLKLTLSLILKRLLRIYSIFHNRPIIRLPNNLYSA